MAPTSQGQRKTIGRVMHEMKHGELQRGPSGKGGKVETRRQAIAIALKEAGASKFESKRDNEKNYARTKRKEARGQTAQQEAEGKSHVGASDGKARSSAASRRERMGKAAGSRKSPR